MDLVRRAHLFRKETILTHFLYHSLGKHIAQVELHKVLFEVGIFSRTRLEGQ